MVPIATKEDRHIQVSLQRQNIPVTTGIWVNLCVVGIHESPLATHRQRWEWYYNVYTDIAEESYLAQEHLLTLIYLPGFIINHWECIMETTQKKDFQGFTVNSELCLPKVNQMRNWCTVVVPNVNSCLKSAPGSLDFAPILVPGTLHQANISWGQNSFWLIVLWRGVPSTTAVPLW